MEKAVPVVAVQHIGGFAGERMEKNKDNYLAKFPIETYIRMEEAHAFKDWDWRQGEQPGKWIESALLTAARTQDAALDEKVHAMYNRLLQSQEADGYIGITSDSVRTPQKPLRGMDAYELYFLQHALLTAYEQWHDAKGLNAAKKLGDYFVQYIGPGKAEFWPTADRYPANVHKVYKGTQHSDIAGHSIHYGWEGTLLIDPMLRLYQLTNDRRYLDWCRWVIGNIDKWSGWNAFSNLDKVAAGTLPINEIQPYVHAHTFQMNFLGFLRMYQVTGDTGYLRKVAGAWNDVAKRQMYITGGVSVGEHYERDYIKPLTGKMLETCATMSWMQLSQYLLELTGDTRYADAMEKLLWNQVFAEQTIDGDCNRYNTPPNGFKPDGYFREPDCCTGSGHRLQSLLPGFIYATGSNAVYINQFVPSETTVSLASGKTTLQQITRYPEDGTVRILVKPAQKTNFTVYVRIPAWCKTPAVLVNGKAIAIVQPGQYAAIQRSWKAGDVITLQLPMQLQWVRHEHYLQTSDKKPYKAVPDDNAPYALVKGPVVYALDNLYYQGDSTLCPRNLDKDAQYVLDNPAGFARIETKGNDMLGPGYAIPVALADGRRITMPVYPFANIGKWYKDAAHKPDTNAQAYSYAIWLKAVHR